MHGASGSPRDLEGFKAVVADDDGGGRSFLSEALRSRGYAVVSCKSGEEAWAAFLEDPPAVVVLGPLLEGGAELCRRFRAHRDGRDPVVLAVAGQDDSGRLAKCLEAGVDDFLPDPTDALLFNVRMTIAEGRIRERRERSRTRRALESRTRELETLLENLQEVFFSVDLTHDRLLQVSRAATVLFGHTPEELRADRALWKRYLLRSAGQNSGRQLLEPRSPDLSVSEYEVRRRDGSTRWVRATVKVESRTHDGIVRADGTVADITLEREAHVELAERNAELAALNRLSELTLAARSLEEAYEPMLEQVAQVTGLPIVTIEHLDRDSQRLVLTASYGLPTPPEAAVERTVSRSLAGLAVESGRPFIERDLKHRRADGREALPTGDDARGYAAFPLTSGAAVVGVLVLADSRPLRSTDRLFRLGANLAATVATYVERLEAEEALRDNERRYRTLAGELQQANRELESFAYSVSHDLRAPLRTMQGFAHTLLQDFGDRLEPEARDYARRIIMSGQRSEALIRDLLAYSRLSLERLELRPVELERVVAAAREQVESDVALACARVQLTGAFPTVLGSHTILVQVLANLISNAVKFVPGSRDPRVRIHAEKRPEHRVRVWVEDNGIGIPEDQRERIFGVFERLEASSARPGTGIGLAIVRRGMQRVGGSCGVTSDPGEGSAFWIELPETLGRA